MAIGECSKSRPMSRKKRASEDGSLRFVIPKQQSSAVKYKWVKGFNRSADANKVGRELMGLQARDGVVRPAAVVEAAMNPKSEMHRIIEWNDERAANLYREEQARSIIRSIRLVYSGDDGEEKERRVFIHIDKSHVDEDEGGGYVLIEKISQFDAEDYVSEKAAQGLIEWCERYAELSEMVPGAFDLVLQAVVIIKQSRKKH